MPVTWIVDGNNVMGSRPDGWWRDRAGAAGRLVDEIDRWGGDGHDVVVVFDGAPHDAVAARGRAGLEVRFAPGGRDSADDHIVDLVEARAAAGAAGDLVVVTADRGLAARLPGGVAVEGPRRFLDRLA